MEQQHFTFTVDILYSIYGTYSISGKHFQPVVSDPDLISHKNEAPDLI
jgi:hypothetical protein